MPALAQGKKAFFSREDRPALRAEIVALQRRVPGLRALSDRAPFAGAPAPGAVGASERVHPVLRGGAAHCLEANVLDPFGRARHEHIAHHAIGDAERRAVDIEPEIRCSPHRDLDQVLPARKRRRRRHRVAGLLFEPRLVLPLPVALHPGAAACRCKQCGEQRPACRQARSSASEARTAEVFSSFSRSRSSSAIAYTRWQPSTCTHTVRSTPFSLASASRRSSGFVYSTNIVAFQLPPSGIIGL